MHVVITSSPRLSKNCMQVYILLNSSHLYLPHWMGDKNGIWLIITNGSPVGSRPKREQLNNKTAELSQRRPRDAPNIWVH